LPLPLADESARALHCATLSRTRGKASRAELDSELPVDDGGSESAMGSRPNDSCQPILWLYVITEHAKPREIGGKSRPASADKGEQRRRSGNGKRGHRHGFFIERVAYSIGIRHLTRKRSRTSDRRCSPFREGRANGARAEVRDTFQNACICSTAGPSELTVPQNRALSVPRFSS